MNSGMQMVVLATILVAGAGALAGVVGTRVVLREEFRRVQTYRDSDRRVISTKDRIIDDLRRANQSMTDHINTLQQHIELLQGQRR